MMYTLFYKLLKPKIWLFNAHIKVKMSPSKSKKTCPLIKIASPLKLTPPQKKHHEERGKNVTLHDEEGRSRAISSMTSKYKIHDKSFFFEQIRWKQMNVVLLGNAYNL